LRIGQNKTFVSETGFVLLVGNLIYISIECFLTGWSQHTSISSWTIE